MKKHYINAVYELILQGKDIESVLSNLKRVLETKSHQQIYSQILEGVVVKLQAKQKSSGATVILAKETDIAKLTSAIEASLTSLGSSLTNAAITTDATLIGGYIALYDGMAIDASHKQKLVGLYRAITK